MLIYLNNEDAEAVKRIADQVNEHLSFEESVRRTVEEDS